MVIRLPTTLEMYTMSHKEIDVDIYKSEISIRLTEAWELAKSNNKRAQGNQKSYYDRQSKLPKFSVGVRVFVYMPAAKAYKAYPIKSLNRMNKVVEVEWLVDKASRNTN